MNKAELVEELKKIGLQTGMKIEVHSSLSSLGYVEGGADTVIEALMECGTLSVEPWYTIQDMAYQKGLIKEGYIGKCKYMFFDIWDVISLYRKELEENPFKLHGLER